MRCRQTIREFSSPDTLILYPAEDGTTAQTTISDILPAAFSEGLVRLDSA